MIALSFNRFQRTARLAVVIGAAAACIAPALAASPGTDAVAAGDSSVTFPS